ncbi:hypothetical protein B0T11DRAFT_285108 [Plectosphaerella cucumerina]|uniref:Uncharacterized protein n=1 Tax=Plectosphaerella cucumerina TaxID=40658 RepID=A0A8K0TDU8_9PEZI|nr:hypothetical protein B0T11DRAFT_285108 [Plectosphaerella cucumerina]
MQAVLALSLAHKQDTLQAAEGSRPATLRGAPDEQEQVVLRHYGRAICLLQPHFSASTRTSVRIAVITCLVFVYLQLLRQQHKTAHALLRTGLGLLRGLQPRPDGDTTLVLKSEQQSIDDYLAEALIRLDIQMALMRHGSNQQYNIVLDPAPLPMVFDSAQAARQRLDMILYEILGLARICRSPQIDLISDIRDRQMSIQAALSSWLTVYDATKAASAGTNTSARDEMGYRLLRIYHAMACVMAATCTFPEDESVFDLHEGRFASIVAQCGELIVMATAPFTIFSIFLGSCPQRVNFLPDMGVIAPLYFTALKCRVRQLRLSAIRLLMSTGYYEGIWNGTAAAAIAWEIAEMERVGTADTAAYGSFQAALCDEGNPEPASSAITSVSDVFPRLTDDPSESIVFICQQMRSDGSWEVIERRCQSA